MVALLPATAAARFTKGLLQPSHAGKFSITLSGGGTAWYEMVFDDRFTVKSFGALSDGAANDRTAFADADAAVPAGYTIDVPAGTYNFGGSDLTANGRRWVFDGSVSIPDGNLLWGTFERHNADNYGSIDAHYQCAGVNWLLRAPYRLGGQRQSPAMSIGSADPGESNYGVVLFADGHSNFLAFMPEEPYNPVEINLYNYCTTGRALSVSRTNRLTRNTANWPSMAFEAAMVGKALYWRGTKYKILTVTSEDEVTVEEWDGTPVSFAYDTDGTYHFTYSMFRGVVDVSGTTVTWNSGHNFYDYFTNDSSVLEIGGTAYEITSIDSDTQITLASSAGTLRNVAYVSYAEIDGETTNIRMNHSIVGEQFSIKTTAGAEDGLGAAYVLSNNKGSGDWIPIVIQNGGKDGLTVVFNNEDVKAFVGVGENRRYPGCELDVNGEIRNTHLAIRANSLEEFGANSDSSLSINYYGYYGTDAHFRDTDIYNGKGQLIASFDGRTRVLQLQNASTVVSDDRLKQDIEPIPDAVLDAWSKVERKRCRLEADPGQVHYGLIAQEVVTAFENAGLDPYQDGPVRKGEDGQLSISYTEAAEIDAAWVRKQLARLELVVPA